MSESANRAAKSERLAALLFANSISERRAVTMTDAQWTLVNNADAMMQRRPLVNEPPSQATRCDTCAELRKLELADFRKRLKAMRRFYRNETRRLEAAKGEVR